MKKRRITALLLAPVLLLTGCLGADYGEDYTITRKDFLDYTLGADSQITLDVQKMGSDGVCYTRWLARYQPQTAGKHREFYLFSYPFGEMPPQDGEDAMQFGDYYLLEPCYREAGSVAAGQLAKECLNASFHMGTDAFEDGRFEPEEDVMLYWEFVPAVLTHNPEYASLLHEEAVPETGFQVCTADLNSMAHNENIITMVTVDISERFTETSTDLQHDPAPYIEYMKQAYEKFLRKTENPQNYRFAVTRTRVYLDGNRDTEFEVLYDVSALAEVGEFNAAERYNDNITPEKKMQEELLEILRQNKQS